MTTTISISAGHCDVALTFLDNVRNPDADVAAVEADPENDIVAAEARTGYMLTTSVQKIEHGASHSFVIYQGRSVVITEMPEAVQAAVENAPTE